MATIDELNIQKLYDTQAKLPGAGLKAGATVSCVEYGDSDGVTHKTVLTLTNTPLPLISVTTGNGVGGTKIYDMPAGWIKFLGGTANLSLTVASGKQADFTDATPAGSLGIGTLAPANADALGTDSTDDNICTATAYDCTAYVDSSITLPPEANFLYNGTSSAADVILTGFVGSADIDDSTTTEVLISGTVTLYWQNLGDY